MKTRLLIIPFAALLAYCSSSKSTRAKEANNTGRQTANVPDYVITQKNSATDTFIVTGTMYIPLEGRSETGTRAELEGAWELDSLNGTVVPGKSNINVEILTKNLPEGTEIRHDSTTTTDTANGVIHTTTSVLVDRMGASGNKITPPQGPNYHIPAKPSINFYGSNETFSGFTGCNKFAGRYTVKDTNNISLQSANASTRMVCIGDYDENLFLNTLRRVNSFKAINGQLELLEGNNVLLVFRKKQ